MALTNTVINRGRNNIGEIIGGASFIQTELSNFIGYLNSNSHFKIFCSGTNIGERIAAQLNQINSVISEKLVSGIESLAGITESFLSSQEQINAGNFLVHSSPISVPLRNSLPFELGSHANTFNARDFEILIGNVDTHLTEISKETKKVANICMENASLFASEDSNIAGAYEKISDVLNSISSKLTSIMHELTEKIKTYIINTIGNEEETTQEIEKINAVVDDALSALNSVGAI